MAKKKKSVPARVKEEVSRSFRFFLVDRIASTLHALIKYSTIPLCAWAFAWAVVNTAPAVAGKETNVSFAIEALINIAASKYAYWIAIAILSAGGWIQRSTYQKRIAKMADQKKDLEKKIDRARSSSGLKPDARTSED